MIVTPVSVTSPPSWMPAPTAVPPFAKTMSPPVTTRSFSVSAAVAEKTWYMPFCLIVVTNAP